jgi:hypothetical protein
VKSDQTLGGIQLKFCEATAMSSFQDGNESWKVEVRDINIIQSVEMKP